ncbi:hypothetical protein P691DRAFT_754359 [Macrolepiota fuliginosa MF-IS2]|uniref:Uncharacterized protein n=1 Tax=Macrolepiota fuliginosa MF-IS2 TaxID=1400762 RepID=A0A9P6C774_9AGAR|nr:hypothetical protein P691DRAFT_754359 [Macrolepiota fuliginosa MF-IS2]
MSHTPRSRTLSRPSPPHVGAPRASPSRLVIPPLHSSPSLSNLHIHSHNIPGPNDIDIPPVPTIPREHALESSASSIINVDMNEGILIQDMDTDTDVAEEDSIEVTRPVAITNEESKKFLREQLRRTLSDKQAQAEHDTPTARHRQPQADLEELSFTAATRFLPREYFVLTDAGKPVFIRFLSSF